MTNAIVTTGANDLERVAQVADWQTMREQASALVRSGFLPRAVDTPEKALALMQTGRELGIGPMQAIRTIHIIDGKPVMAAELIAGLVLSRHRGATLRVVNTTEKLCVVVAARHGQEPTEFRWTSEDAQRAGLTNKDNWRKYPRAMLRNRCLAEAARGIFPDCTMGLYDPDELGAVTDASGEPIEETRTRSPTVSEAVRGDDPVQPMGEGQEHLVFSELERRLKDIESRIVYATTYDECLAIRAELGSKAKPKDSPMTRDIQAAGPELRLITGPEYKALNKAWARCDRQLTIIEAKLKPSVEDSFRDEPEDDRQPGEEG